MNLLASWGIGPGSITAVRGNPVCRSAFLERLARTDELSSVASLLSFAQHAAEAQSAGWPEARYYEHVGKTVDEFLSYDDVWEVNPFEVGAHRPETRKVFNERKRMLLKLLGLEKFRRSLVLSLSNGETRRVLFAHALAKGPKILLLDDPAAGLDVNQRAKLKDILTALAKRGVAILMAAAHDDELPEGVTHALRVTAKGIVRVESCAGCAGRPGVAPYRAGRSVVAPYRAERSVAAPYRAGRPVVKDDVLPPPVVEIRHLTLAYGSRELFHDFSWCVRKGERWILRGENGSGKTTLFALITGDSPLAYAFDVRVFGQRRDIGCQISKIRARIGRSSPETQACLGRTAEELLDAALAGDYDLLLLDEPFMNMSPAVLRRAKRKLTRHLKAHPEVTAIVISHRQDDLPALFTRELMI